MIISADSNLMQKIRVLIPTEMYHEYQSIAKRREIPGSALVRQFLFELTQKDWAVGKSKAKIVQPENTKESCVNTYVRFGNDEYEHLQKLADEHKMSRGAIIRIIIYKLISDYNKKPLPVVELVEKPVPEDVSKSHKNIFSFFLTESLRKDIKEYTKTNGIKASELYRRAIANYTGKGPKDNDSGNKKLTTAVIPPYERTMLDNIAAKSGVKSSKLLRFAIIEELDRIKHRSL